MIGRKKKKEQEFSKPAELKLPEDTAAVFTAIKKNTEAIVALEGRLCATLSEPEIGPYDHLAPIGCSKLTRTVKADKDGICISPSSYMGSSTRLTLAETFRLRDWLNKVFGKE